ncbi:DUF885 domain-containing protein [Streptomyces sp. NBC_01275]|uniref:DUF885 family protein n=1 Tax=Streptomyces sp. NBC_01275 TaxID=2903807 RepID=UPI00225B574B|nr:DUF885 family protein [Streptomyces sp. NBC_01275]MCX4762819.1 DUF885 domain-containing protein [Streptomyces sp. NBC_01275]
MTSAAQNSVSAVVDYVFERYPQVGRRAGCHAFDARLPDVVPDAPSDVDGLLTAVRAQLDALPGDADAEVRADLGTAMRVLTDERFRIAELGRAHRGPDLWLAEADVHVYLRGEYAPLDERVAALSRHLAQLPDFLGAAAKTLGGTLPAGERISGIENARARAASVANTVAQLVARRPEAADSSLLELAGSASAAFTGFAAEVAATEPVRAIFGPDLLAAYLEAAEGVDTPVDELLAEVEAEVQQLVARLDALAARLGVRGRQEAYALLSAQLPAGSVVTALSGIIERLREFWAEQDVVTLTSRYGLDIRPARDASTSAAVVFDHAGPLETVPQPHVLHVPEPRDPAALRDYLNEPMLEMIAVHEVVPGHYLHHEAAPEHAGVIRRCVPWFPGTTEGWAHYTEELAIERGLAEGRPLVEVAALRFALEAAARLLMFLSVHSGRKKFGAAAAEAATLCAWSPERAGREVLAVVANPAGAMYTLGKLHIRRWRELAGVRDSAADLKAFHDRLLRCGGAPLSTVWRYYLDGRPVPAASTTTKENP